MAQSSKGKRSQWSTTIHNVADDQLECCIEKKAAQLHVLRQMGDGRDSSARIKAIQEDVAILCYKYFYVVGPDVGGQSADELFVQALAEAIRTYDANRGRFVPYVRSWFGIARLRAYDAAEGKRKKGKDEEEAKKKDKVEIVDLLDEAGNEMSYVPHEVPAIDDHIALEEDSLVFGELLRLVCQFLDHREDGRHSESIKVQRRMVFTEMITRLVKMQARREHLKQFSRHERDTVRSSEVPFLDTYMVREFASRFAEDTRGFLVFLWACDLRTAVEGFDGAMLPVSPIRRFDELTGARGVWQLPNGLFLKYFHDAYNEDVRDSGSVSHWRKQFYGLIGSVRNAVRN